METNSSFLGTGWSFPPTFNRDTATVEMVSDEEDIVQSLEIILSTRPAERIMQPDFGCELSQFLFEEISQGLITGIRGTISDAILYHEPRIDVDEIEIDESEEQGLLLISITYTVRTTNSRFNLVYPFYINEAQTV
ncbi:MAG: GPW/gp25 family protein [Xenococcus sp. MO_188.B8]|nr:GPW/gp25 family protein [Xenococcus sp. MO_188.B8]